MRGRHSISSARPRLAPLLAILGLSHAMRLYDIPVSNHGARVRYLLYKKQLEVEVISPGKLGGLGSDEYKALNPQAKMPLLVDGDLSVWESDAICRHLLDKHAGAPGPSFSPSTLEARTTSEMLCRLHDAYIGPIQGCLYRAPPHFGRHGSRRAAIADLLQQLRVAEDLASADGPYLTGAEVSLADATLFPTVAFVVHMLPKFAELAPGPHAEPRDAAAGALGPKLLAWWQHMSEKDAEGARVLAELRGGLQKWEAQARWAPLLGAGVRDDAPPTLFDMILAGDIPSDRVYEDERCLAFRDISPVAPTHILIIPKRRDGLSGLGAATAEHADILGHLMVAAAAVAKQEGLDEFRVVANNGESAGQSVFHLHLHLIGGRDLQWPPG